MQSRPVEQVVQEQFLVPLYGVEKAKVVVKYITEFLPYRNNFDGDVTAGFYEAQGRKWLLLNCPLVLSTEPPTKLTIGVAFPPLFPEKWPYCVINDIGVRKLAQDHPFVAANGVIRVQSLPLLQGSNDVPPLIQLFVSIQCALSDLAPFAPSSAAAAVIQSPCAPPPSKSPHASPTVVAQQAPGAASSTAATTTPVSAQRQKLLRAASEVLYRHLLQQQDQYIDTREQCLKHLAFLNASRDALRSLESTLAEKKRKLLEVQGPMIAAHQQALRWREKAEQAPVDPRNVIVATDRGSEVALQLQAEVHAYDDAYDVIERALKKGQLSCDDYVRDVSDIARMQFLSKFQLERVMSSIARDSSLASLKAKFPMLGAQVVEDVYVNADCNVELAATHLRAMMS